MPETPHDNTAVLTETKQAGGSEAAGLLNDTRNARPAGAREKRPMPPGQVRDLVVCAVWLGLAAGLIEAGFWAFQKFVLGRLIFMHPAVFWLAPLVGLSLFVVPGALIVAAARAVRHPTMLPFGVTLLSVLLWLNVLFLVEGLHPLAEGVLACGLAAVTGFLFERRSEKLARLMRRSLAWIVAGVLLIAVVQQTAALSRSGRTSQAARGASPAAKRPPNVLLIVLDTVRADALGVYGAERDLSPNIDRFAQRGVVFEQASSTAPWTLPSTAGMFTGRLPSEHSADWMSPLDDRYPTLAERLRGEGYRTAGFVANTRYCSAETGLARGFEHYEDYRLSWADFASSSALVRRCFSNLWLPKLGLYDYPGRKPAEEINERFLSWLDSARGERRRESGEQRESGKLEGRGREGERERVGNEYDSPSTTQRSTLRPWFAFLNYWDAHDPYVAPPPFDEHRPRSDFHKLMIRYWWWMRKDKLKQGDVDLARSAYEDCIRYLDAQVGELLSELQRRGVLQETVVIITADHGEHFGEHGLLLHGNSLYEPLLHVPLIVVDGRKKAGNEQEGGSSAQTGSAVVSRPPDRDTHTTEGVPRTRSPGADPFASIRIPDPVSLRSLPATVLELAGADRQNAFPGRSLSRYRLREATNGPSEPAPVLAEIATQAGFPPCHGRSPIARGPMASVRVGRFKYIRNGDGQEELYDLKRDPREQNNLADDEAQASTLGKLRAILPE